MKPVPASLSYYYNNTLLILKIYLHLFKLFYLKSKQHVQVGIFYYAHFISL